MKHASSAASKLKPSVLRVATDGSQKVINIQKQKTEELQAARQSKAEAIINDPRNWDCDWFAHYE